MFYEGSQYVEDDHDVGEMWRSRLTLLLDYQIVVGVRWPGVLLVVEYSVSCVRKRRKRRRRTRKTKYKNPALSRHAASVLARGASALAAG